MNPHTHLEPSISCFIWMCTDNNPDEFCETASASGYRSITKDGLTREYLLDVPESYDIQVPHCHWYSTFMVAVAVQMIIERLNPTLEPLRIPTTFYWSIRRAFWMPKVFQSGDL